jgi:hypothetical protein
MGCLPAVAEALAVFITRSTMAAVACSVTCAKAPTTHKQAATIHLALIKTVYTLTLTASAEHKAVDLHAVTMGTELAVFTRSTMAAGGVF